MLYKVIPNAIWCKANGYGSWINLCFVANVNKMFYHQGIYVLYNRQLWCLWCILDGMAGFLSLFFVCVCCVYGYTYTVYNGTWKRYTGFSFHSGEMLIIQNGSQKYCYYFNTAKKIYTRNNILYRIQRKDVTSFY